MRRALFLAILVVSFFLLGHSRAFCLQDEGEGPDSGGSDQAIGNEYRQQADAAESGEQDLSGEEEKIIETIRNSLAASSVSDGFDIPVVLNDAVDLYIKYFTGTGRKIFAHWLDRAKKYEPTIRAILRKNGLPEDLVYVAMIESGFDMKARSHAKALGPWQFIHETGQRYGLKVDFWVDERCNIEKSTVAAARYLKELFDRFGCWYLAAAGYNAGEHRVERAIAQKDTKDFWKLREYKTLPKETQEYVPQLIAAALIAKDPEKYGFDDPGHPPIYKLMKIGVPGGIALGRIASALSMDVAEVKALNPEITRGVTPPNRHEYQLTLPETSSPDAVREKLDAELEGGRQVVGVVKCCVKKGNSVAGILRRYRVSRSDLMLVNEGGDRFRLAKGQILYIPRFAPGKQGACVRAVADKESREIAIASTDDENEVVVLRSAGKRHGAMGVKPALVRHVIHKAGQRLPHKVRNREAAARVRRTHSR
jgi:membrane-bound lytic murein transglycosylase D